MLVRTSKYCAFIPDHVKILNIDRAEIIEFSIGDRKETIHSYGVVDVKEIWAEWFTRLNSKKRVFDVYEWIKNKQEDTLKS